jgi:uncharacterized membrane protein
MKNYRDGWIFIACLAVVAIAIWLPLLWRAV